MSNDRTPTAPAEQAWKLIRAARYDVYSVAPHRLVAEVTGASRPGRINPETRRILRRYGHFPIRWFGRMRYRLSRGGWALSEDEDPAPYRTDVSPKEIAEAVAKSNSLHKDAVHKYSQLLAQGLVVSAALLGISISLTDIRSYSPCSRLLAVLAAILICTGTLFCALLLVDTLCILPRREARQHDREFARRLRFDAPLQFAPPPFSRWHKPLAAAAGILLTVAVMLSTAAFALEALQYSFP